MGRLKLRTKEQKSKSFPERAPADQNTKHATASGSREGRGDMAPPRVQQRYEKAKFTTKRVLAKKKPREKRTSGAKKNWCQRGILKMRGECKDTDAAPKRTTFA